MVLISQQNKLSLLLLPLTEPDAGSVGNELGHLVSEQPPDGQMGRREPKPLCSRASRCLRQWSPAELRRVANTTDHVPLGFNLMAVYRSV